MSFANTLPFCSRSRFFVKLVGSQTGTAAAAAEQTIVVQLLHQLSFRPNAVERLHSNCSGGIEGHPSFEWSLPKLRFSSPSTSQTSARVLLSGWFGDTSRRDVRKQPALIHKCALHTSLHQS
jgi:hypothetical protein